MAVVGSHFWFRRSFGSHDASCMDVSYQLPILARQPFFILFGVVVWCCCLTSIFLTCLGVDRVGPSCVNVVGLTCGSAVFSDCALPVVWPFHS